MYSEQFLFTLQEASVKLEQDYDVTFQLLPDS